MPPLTLRLAVFVVLALVVWVGTDVRYMLTWTKRRDGLRTARLWVELRDYLYRDARTLRPFVRLIRAFSSPGASEAGLALALRQLGLDEEAIVYADRAVARARGRPKVLLPALAARVLILDALGRYDDARASARQIESIAGPASAHLVGSALVEQHSGALEAALAKTRIIIAASPRNETARTIASLVFTLRGDFAAALSILDAPMRDALELFEPKALRNLQRMPEGADYIARVRARFEETMVPARFIAMAQVLIAAGDARAANEALDRASGWMRSSWAIEVVYLRTRAHAHAIAGDAPASDAALASMWTLLRGYPFLKRAWDSHFVTGTCHLLLGRVGEANDALAEAERAALHPIERHQTEYWRARTDETAGRADDARRRYAAVVAQGIPSWMAAMAAKATAEAT